MKSIFKTLAAFGWLLLLTECTTVTPEVSFSREARFAGIGQVRLLDGPFLDARNRDADYLKSLSPDRLLATFRITAGLTPKAEGYKGWEERELRGHFTGHYLSACSMRWAATGDSVMKNRAAYIASELRECQNASGDGYISAFPREFIDRVEQVKPVWAPYYTIHKILAGLTDTYVYCQDTVALNVACRMAGWIGQRINRLTETQIQDMLDHTEQGGMNEVLYNLYAITGNRELLDLAGKFYQDSYFRPLAEFRDTLRGQHVNSFIPNVIGIARGFELTGDPTFGAMSEFFWNTVVNTRSFVTGGTSNGEIWGSAPYHIHSEIGPSSHESCCTYNLMKLSRHLWVRSQDSRISDYYERALWNGILPTQHPGSGMNMYYVPMASGYYKTFGTPENSFWCCTGTGVENFARSGESIYAMRGSQLYVDQYVASCLNLDSAGIGIRMETGFPEEEEVRITVQTGKPAAFGINLRIPWWVDGCPVISLNGKLLDYSSGPSGYFRIQRTWKNGDGIVLRLPMALHEEYMPDAKDRAALMYGPVVLAGELGSEGLSDAKVYGHYGPYEDKPVEVPALWLKKDLSGAVVRQGTAPLEFRAWSEKGDSVRLIPFYRLFDQRYAIYWKIRKD